MHRVDINTYMKSMKMVTTKPEMLLRLNVLLFTLVFAVIMIYFPSTPTTIQSKHSFSTATTR